MTSVILACGGLPPELAGTVPHEVVTTVLSAVPGRRELRVLDELASSHLPVDPTPSSTKLRRSPTFPTRPTPSPHHSSRMNR